MSDTYGDGEYYGNRWTAVLDAIAPEFADAREVLDVGCGNCAYLTKFVAAPGDRRVTGVDITFDMLLSARNRVGAKCRLIRANVAQLPFKPASFDFIFASHAMLADLAKAGVPQTLTQHEPLIIGKRER